MAWPPCGTHAAPESARDLLRSQPAPADESASVAGEEPGYGSAPPTRQLPGAITETLKYFASG